MPLCRILIPPEGGGGSVTLNPVASSTVKDVMRQVQTKLQKMSASPFNVDLYILSINQSLCWWKEDTKLFEEVVVDDDAVLPLYFVFKTEVLSSGTDLQEPNPDSKSDAKFVDVKEFQAAEATPAVWRARTDCGLCHAPFTFTTRSHHCRKCGEEVCGACSRQAWKLSKSRPAVRVCDSCHQGLQQTGERVVPLPVISVAPPSFVDATSVKACALCLREPVLGRRRLHYCRVCGNMFCVSCAPTKIDLPDNFRTNPKDTSEISSNPVRACSHCLACLEEGVYVLSDAKFSKASESKSQAFSSGSTELPTPTSSSRNVGVLSGASSPRSSLPSTTKRASIEKSNTFSSSSPSSLITNSTADVSSAQPLSVSSSSSTLPCIQSSSSSSSSSSMPHTSLPTPRNNHSRSDSKDGNEARDREVTPSIANGRAASALKLLGKSPQMGATSPLPALVADVQEEDTQSAIYALLGLSGALEKVYDAGRVRFYRSQSTASSEASAWNCPEFLSEPSARMGCSGSASVHLDECTYTFAVTDGDTVQSVIDRTLVEALGVAGKRGDMVLRVRGLQSFLIGTKTLAAYQCVREALRRGKQLNFLLIPKPSASHDTPAWTGWGGGVQTLPPLPKTVSLSDVIAKSGVFSASQLSLHGLPLDSKGSVVVRFLLLHGCSLLPDSCVSSAPSPYVQTSSKKESKKDFHTGSCAWANQELVLPVFSQGVPRETKVAFAVSLVNAQTSELVACGTLPLFDERGLMVQGVAVLRLHEPLRRIALELGDEEEKLEELVALLARTPIGDNPTKHAPMLSVRFAEFGSPVLFSDLREAAPKTSRFTLSAGLSKCARCGYPQEKDSKWCFGCGRRNEQTNQAGKTDVLSEPSNHRQTVAESRDVLLARDPLYQLTPSDKMTLWSCRDTLVDKPHMLPFFLQSTDWSDPNQRVEAHKLLSLWAAPAVETCLQLLDVNFGDSAVRAYATHHLSRLPASQLEPFLLQLTQCLKFELYHHSPLSVLLVRKALQHPVVIGHSLFWHLKTEMQCQPAFAERFCLILADILSCGGPLVRELRRQSVCLEQLTRVAEQVVVQKAAGKLSKDKIQAGYLEELVKLNCYFFARLNKLMLPLNPQVEVGTLIVEKCRFMSSKKVPLWLVFQNADRSDAKPVYVLFKSGDDLRQDILTLQLLRTMDDIWLSKGLDLRLTPYRVVSTGVNHLGEGLGMIEVVLDSDTTSGIQADFGGGALGAFKLNTIYDFLLKHNSDEVAMDAAKEQFMRSSAGYCVATYIIGIGDRHNGNIMVTKDGRLFHIDFGHFLGNFKSKFGYKRERAPFVFTPEMAYVIGGKNFAEHASYQQFEQLCVQAFNALRARAALLETLFGLMVSAGMPELLHVSDIGYMRDQLCLDLSDEEAAVVFLRDLKTSVTATSRRIDNFIHIAKHG